MTGVGLAGLAAHEMLHRFRAGSCTPAEVAEAVLEKAHGAGARLNAFVSVFDDETRQAAIAAPVPDGRLPLAGLPISVKDDLFTAGLRTTGGSPLFRDFVPAHDAPAIARLRRAGAIVFAKCNLSDFAMSAAPGSTLRGACRNPWDPARSAGASSSGCASAVAAGIGPVSIATDTGGSIRYPAALCGVFGFAPSNGRVPRHGSFGANHLFCAIGVISRCAADAALLLSVMSGADASDPQTCPFPAPLPADLGPADLRALRLGVWTLRCADDDADAAADRHLRAVLSRIRTGTGWNLPAVDLSLDGTAQAFRVISDCDRLALMTSHGTWTAEREARLPHVLAQRFAHARACTGADYALALETRRAFMARVDAVFAHCDVLVSLACAQTAPRLEDAESAPLPDLAWTNFAGCPAATLPIGTLEGLPLGMHLVARPGADVLLLQVCAALERLLAQPDPSAAAAA